MIFNKFKINFRSKEAKLPPDFLQGDRKLLIAIIRAFLIDEGCVKDRNIIFCSGSLELLKNLVVVCNNLGYKCQKLKKSNNVHYFDISPDSFEKAYHDLMSIGPLPIKEKQELLDLGIKIIKNKPNFSELNQQIENILKKKPSTNC